MVSIDEIRRRCRGVLEELDGFAEGAALSPADAEALDDLNAELEDALMLLSEIRAGDADWRQSQLSARVRKG